MDSNPTQPFVFKISNNSESDVHGLEILGASENLNNPNFEKGVLTISNVTISSLMSNISYHDFLFSNKNWPFEVAETFMMYAQKENELPITDFPTLTLSTRDSNGNTSLKTLSGLDSALNYANPYDNISKIAARIKYTYKIDEYTKLIISEIKAGYSLLVYFFPSKSIKIAS